MAQGKLFHRCYCCLYDSVTFAPVIGREVGIGRRFGLPGAGDFHRCLRIGNSIFIVYSQCKNEITVSLFACLYNSTCMISCEHKLPIISITVWLNAGLYNSTCMTSCEHRKQTRLYTVILQSHLHRLPKRRLADELFLTKSADEPGHLTGAGRSSANICHFQTQQRCRELLSRR